MLPKIENILYATDMGPGSSHIFRYALSVAHQYQAKVRVLHVVEPLSTFGQSLVELYISHHSSEEQHAENRQTLIVELKRRIHDICIKETCEADENLIEDVNVLEGQAAKTILKEAKRLNSDLIIMGTHRHSAIESTLLGGTAQKVLHNGSVPTLLVRAPIDEDI